MLGDAAHTTPSLQHGHVHATESLLHISTANFSASSSTANPNGTQSEAAIVTSNGTPVETHVKCTYVRVFNKTCCDYCMFIVNK